MPFCHSISPLFHMEHFAGVFLTFVYCKNQPMMDAPYSDAVKSPRPVLPNAESARSPVEPACRPLQASSQADTRAYRPESGALAKREPSWQLRGHRRGRGRGRVGRRGRVRRAVRRVPRGKDTLHSGETLLSTMYFRHLPTVP